METKQKNMEGTGKNIAAFTITTGDWAVQSKQLRKKFSQLTEADLKFETGKEEDLLKRMETRLHEKRDEVIGIIKKEQTPNT